MTGFYKMYDKIEDTEKTSSSSIIAENMSLSLDQ